MSAHQAACRALVLLLGVICADGARGDSFPPYRVEVTPVLHTGDPAPGISGAVMASMFVPQIDGCGNVLIDGYISAPGVTSANDSAVWYGQPGQLALVYREGGSAPDIPGAFISEPLEVYLSESGLIALSCYLAGPSINPAVNARGTFVGPPGQLHKIVQAGDPAPFTEPGTVFASGIFAGVRLSDAGNVLVIYDLAGPAVNSTNDQAMYVGYPSNPQLLWRKAMPAPGTEPGVVFAWAEFETFSDPGRVAFIGGLTGPGVTSANNTGYWSGPAGALNLVAREGSPIAGAPDGAYLAGVGGVPALNSLGDIGFSGLLGGPGVGTDNDVGYWAGPPENLRLVFRRGSTPPGFQRGITLRYGTFSEAISASRDLLALGLVQGPGVTAANDLVIFVGPIGWPAPVLREGDAVPEYGQGTVVAVPDNGEVIPVLNDFGGGLFRTRLAGPTVTPSNDFVAWYFDPHGRRALPLLRSGQVIEGRTLAHIEWGDQTGGSDGHLQGFGDSGVLAGLLQFADGSWGVYAVVLRFAGDLDRDTDVDLRDFALLANCFSGAGLVGPACAFSDAQSDGSVNLLDYVLMFESFTGP